MTIRVLSGSIRWRIFSYYTALMVTAVALLVGAHVWTERNSLKQETELRLQAHGIKVLPMFFAPRPGSPPPAPFQERQEIDERIPPPELPQFRNATESLKQTGDFVVARSHMGKVLFQSENAPDPAEWPKFSEEDKQFAAFQTASNLFVLVRTPRGGHLLVGTSLSGLAKREKDELLRAAAVGAGVLLLVSLCGFLIIERALRPIEKIAVAARRIAKGDLSDRIDIRSQRSELGQLAKILNTTFARLQETLQRQVRFTADASHELRTPVAAILADCQFSLKRPRSTERYLETIEVCHESAQHMRSLIERLGVMAKFDANDALAEREDIDLADLAEQAADMVVPLANERGIRVETELAAASVQGDRLRLGQAVINLLNNAVSYNRPEGQVWLRTGRRDGMAFIEVEDTGIGIPSDKVELVFERFFRVDDSRNDKTGGSGLGLAICRSIVEAHGGCLTASSELGKGSRFRIELPTK